MFYNDQLRTDVGATEAHREASRSRVGGWIVCGLMATTVLVGFWFFLTRSTRHPAAAAPVVTDHVAAQGGSGLPWLFVLAAAYVVARVAFKTGQYHRGWMHARTIRKSHWAAIQGRGH